MKPFPSLSKVRTELLKDNLRPFINVFNLILTQIEIIKSYEAKLKEMNPTVRDITYDIKDLYNFVDHFADIGVLV